MTLKKSNPAPAVLREGITRDAAAEQIGATARVQLGFSALEIGVSMNHEQTRHEKHEQGRKEKQLHERLSEEQFSKPGPTIRPLWLLAAGIILTMTALFIWWQF
jgi:hypothetical protein